MKYQKPELNVLGSAPEVILLTHQKNGSQPDGSIPANNPAYDLDE